MCQCDFPRVRPPHLNGTIKRGRGWAQGVERHTGKCIQKTRKKTATPYPKRAEDTSLGELENISTAFCLFFFFFTYLLPCGGRRERQRVGLRGGLHWAGGCLDHFNCFGVAHLSQGLHQLSDCTPRDLWERKEAGACSCVRVPVQAVSTDSPPFPLPCCLLHSGARRKWKGQRRATKKIQSSNQVSCFGSKTTQEITEKWFVVSRERDSERSAEAVKLCLQWRLHSLPL